MGNNKNKIYKSKEEIVRVLGEDTDKILIIDCIKRSMPKWMDKNYLNGFTECKESDLRAEFEELDNLSPRAKQAMYERYKLILGILPFIKDEHMRSKAIESISGEQGISKQTIRRYLCAYLCFQDIRALAPVEKKIEAALSVDEKNMRFALNKFFYNKNKNSLKYAYRMLLKEKYCDADGRLQGDYPSFYQFRYFYRKTRKLETFYISRDGIKDYQKNNRPLLGDGVQQFAPCIGSAMLDATVCDIYLVNERGQIIGRPILTAAIDAYSGLCMGYSLTLEGGMYSLRNLLLNVVTDKVEHCKKFGIGIERKDWNASSLPYKIITDRGSEYKGENLEQISDLGVTIVNLPAYRPDLKGIVEKFFDVVQGYFKPYLKGKGVIEPDFRERGAHDYRKDAALTFKQFEAIIIHCILFYNSKRILENFPFTEEMLNEEVRPYASCVWDYGLKENKLIEVDKNTLILTLLPRTGAKFTRQGLKANGLRYRNELFREEYLEGREAITAYNPDDVTSVYLMENGRYIKFELIESRFMGKSLEEVESMRDKQACISKREQENKLQAEIDLSNHIIAIRNQGTTTQASIKDIRESRKRERIETHINYAEGL